MVLESIEIFMDSSHNAGNRSTITVNQ